MNKVKVLFLAANPTGTIPLKLDEEIRAITAKIRASEYRDSLDLVSVWAVRPDDLLQALNEHKPQIVHFSGHGSQTGEIILVDNLGQPKPVSEAAIKALFKALKDNVRVVVLNSCYSKIQAIAITEVIDCVVGMDMTIGDQASITFAASFYGAIGFGRSIHASYEQGKVALMLEDSSEATAPDLLYRQGIDPTQVYLLHDRPTQNYYSTNHTAIRKIERDKKIGEGHVGTQAVKTSSQQTTNRLPAVAQHLLNCGFVRNKYLRCLIEDYRDYRIEGFKTRGPFVLDLERVFVPLRVSPQSPGRISSDMLSQGRQYNDYSIWDLLAPDKQSHTYRERLRLGLLRFVRSLIAPDKQSQADRPLYRCVAVIGPPGSGKTTLLRYLTLAYARGIQHHYRENARPLVPILLLLRDHAQRIISEPNLSLPTILNGI